MKVTEIVIENLFGKDYVIHIKDNKLILIGVNGTCKSIILSIISDLLQKEKNSYYEFDRAYVAIDDVNYEVLNKNKRLVYPINYKENAVLYINSTLYDFFSMRPNNKNVIPIINKYFSDSDKIVDMNDDGNIIVKENGIVIPIECLSNGERKIIRFMTFFYSLKESVSVIIDNPEDYLSVRWQEHFLDDIMNSGMCNLLIAATHSPFIFDNELDNYSYDILDFKKEKS